MGRKMVSLGTVPLPPNTGHRRRRRGAPVPAENLLRARVTNNPLSRASRNTASGRRIRDLYNEFAAVLGNPRSPTTQAELLALAELTTLCESKREQALNGERSGDKALSILVRLEGQVARRRRRLGLDQPPAAPVAPTLDEYLTQNYAQQEAAE